MATTSRDDALTTYRYLRIAMPLLVVILGAAISYQIFLAGAGDDCFLGSISAYYYTSARAVFVACLCAIGTCLVIYRGNTTREDVALNITGFMAFFVAFIPTPLKKVDGPEEVGSCARSNVPEPGQLVAAVNNNVFALLVGATVAVGVIAWFRSRPSTPEGPQQPSRAALVGTGIAVLAAWAVFAASPERVRSDGHLATALVLFAGIVLVVFMNGFTLSRLDPQGVPAQKRYRGAYRLVLGGMALVGIAALGMKLNDSAHVIFVLEAGIIVLFAVFWVVQTYELWGVARRDQLRAVGSGRMEG